MKYTCLNPIAACGLDLFSEGYEKTETVDDADVILVRSAAMHDMDLPDSVKAIARAGAGVNNIPLDKCAERGIVVFNSPGANANGVKELVLCGMLLACRDIKGGMQWVEENKDDENIAKAAEKAKKAFAGTEIAGKTLGVIGLGAIGVRLANAALDLGMNVIGYDPFVSIDSAWHISDAVKRVNSPEDIYRSCDFISIHVPAMKDTIGMISKEAIAMMKENAVVLNFARNTLVDEEAMVEALAAGKVHKYVVDFPTPATAGKEGCLVIPHLGASTEESEDNCAIMAVNELIDFIENGNIRNSVNYPVCDMGVCKSAGRVSVTHKNIANTISEFTSVFGSEGINISDFTSKSRGDFAYSLLDVDSPVTEHVIEKLEALDGVIRVRVIK